MKICKYCYMSLVSRGEIEKYTVEEVDYEETFICEWCGEEIEEGGEIYEV